MQSVFGGGESSGNSAGSKSIEVFGGTASKSKEGSTPFSSSSEKNDDKVESSVSTLASSDFLWPVNGGKISSYYGWRSAARFHDGLDISAPTGTSIYASKSGTVIYSDNRIRGYGNMIVLKHDDGYSTVYAHNKNNLVNKGQSVRRGEIIAYLGSTGYSTGPHLHFEIRKGKYSKDPLIYLNTDKSKKTDTSGSTSTFLGF